MAQSQTIWDLHLASGRHLLRKQRDVPGYEAATYSTQRLWATTRDGQRVQITLTWRPQKASADGRAPLLVRGYGAYRPDQLQPANLGWRY